MKDDLTSAVIAFLDDNELTSHEKKLLKKLAEKIVTEAANGFPNH
jgi:hypothetical protein